MRTGNSISKPVWFVAAALVLLTVVLVILVYPTAPGGRKPVRKETAIARTNQKTAVHPTVTPPTNSATPAVVKGQLPPVIPIPLKPILTTAENGSWLRDKDYLQVPHTPQDFGGVRFLMDGMIQLQGSVSKDYKHRHYRRRVLIPLAVTNVVNGKPVVLQRGSNVATLFLLGGTRYGYTETQCAEIVWHYADGTSRRTPIEHLKQFRDWVRNPYEMPAHLPYAFSKVAWAVPRPSHPTQWLRLYRAGFANPEPNKVVRDLGLVSTMKAPTLFIIGVTLDPVPLGERPDNTPDLEPTDDTPPNHIAITVENRKGVPIPQADLRIGLQRQNGRSRSSYSLKTDDFGEARVAYPPRNLDRLEIEAARDGYSGRSMTWDLKGGDTVPASYTLKLRGAVNIGGIIVDTTGYPVGGANVSLYRFWTGSDDINRRGEQADFQSQSTTTDAQGKWHARGLPPSLLDRIGFYVTDPDFIGTNVTVGANGTTEKQLRAGTFKIVLHRGLEVFGQVLDDQGSPVSGATVWAGRRYYRDRKQTKSDAQGQFLFSDISKGNVLFSVMADGHSPANKTVNVHHGMDEIVFRLGAGDVIRAHVQNQAGDPIAEANVALEGQPGEAAYDAYEFSTTTDRRGDFEWDSAPDTPMPFYVFHKGYEAKRGVKLAPNQDNVVILHRSRHVQGLVMDAESEQPVTQFEVRAGNRPSKTTQAVYGVIQSHHFSAADGRFTLDLDEENDNAIEVTADGYADQVQSLPEGQNGIVKILVRMKPSPDLNGVVLTRDGTPAPGTSVAAVSVSGGPGSAMVRLSNGRLQTLNSRSKVVTADAEGQFRISSPPDNGRVVAAGDSGFASASIAQVRAGAALTLQAYGRIEGTLKIGGQPSPGKRLMLTLDISNVLPDWNSYQATTDDQGAFSFERVPPGDVAIVRLIQTMPNTWTHSYRTAVHVEAGQTTTVSLGDSGAVIRGSVRFESPPTNRETLSISGQLSTPMPPTPTFHSAAEARGYFNTPQWRKQMERHKSFAFAVNADGTFVVDSVPPGTYTLIITAQRPGRQPLTQAAVASGSSTVTVREGTSPLSEINVGSVVLVPVHPRPAQPLTSVRNQ